MTETVREVLPQPWEGVNGTEQTGDDLLSLEDEAMPRRRQMIMMALLLHRATLVGNPAPVVRRIWDRISAPQPGDLVVETTCARRPGSEHRGFGILLSHRREWCLADTDWAAYLAENPQDDERTTDNYWYVQYGPGERDIARWENCDFMAILDEAEVRAIEDFPLGSSRRPELSPARKEAANRCACWETCQNDAEPDSDPPEESCSDAGCPAHGDGERWDREP